MLRLRIGNSERLGIVYLVAVVLFVRLLSLSRIE